VNLREWALEQGVHPKTAYRWFREGMLPVPARRAGRLILVDPDPEPAVVGRVVAYCRVCSADRSTGFAEIRRQLDYKTAWNGGAPVEWMVQQPVTSGRSLDWRACSSP
jgi:putative resolvase